MTPKVIRDFDSAVIMLAVTKGLLRTSDYVNWMTFDLK